MDHIASAPRLYILKSQVKIAHQPGYALYGGRWHAVHEHKPAPKGAPLSAHPTAAGVHAPVKHFTDEQWEQLKLPAENSNAGTFNKQLKQLQEWSDAGDVTAIVGAGFGVNTYGKKLATIANHLLGLHGSPHKVAAGQKPGWHAAVEHAPAQADKPAPTGPSIADLVDSGALAPAPQQTEPPAAAPAQSVDVPMPTFDPNYKATPFYQKVAAELKKLADAGDIEGVKAANDGSSAWQGKSPNSTKLLHYHLDLLDSLEHATGKVGAYDEAAKQALASKPAPVEPEPTVAPTEAPAAPPPEASAPPATAGNTLLAQIPWDTYVLPTSNTNAGSFNKKLAQVKALAEAGDVAGLEAMTWGVNTYGKKGKLIAQAAIAALKDGAPAASDVQPLEPPAVTQLKFSKPTKPDVFAFALSAGDIEEFLGQGDAASIKELLSSMDEPDVSPTSDLGKVLAYAKDALAYLEQNRATTPTKPDEGPKEGDLKQGADGMLVLKDGHWVKVAEEPAPTEAPTTAPEPAAATGVAGVDIPDFMAISPNKWGTGYANVAKELKIAALEHGAAGLKGKIVNHKDGSISIKAAGWHLKHLKSSDGEDQPSKRRAAMVKFVKALQEAAGKAPKAKKAASAPAPEAPPAPAAPALPSMDDWEQIGPQGGSNPGGKFKAPDGTEYYCKFPANEDIAKSEVLAAKLYAATGLAGQDAMLVTKNGKVGIASKWVNVKKAPTTGALAKAPDAQGGFAVDAWLGNWDVVGLGYDNLQLGADGKAVRVDAGGSLEYRAQGSKKPFGHHVTELDTLRDKAKNPQAAAIFGSMTDADIAASVAKVAAVSDHDIRQMVDQYGPGSAAEKKALAATLIARKADLLAKYPKAAIAVAKGSSWVRLKPGERIVEAGEKFGVQWAKIKVPPKGFHADAIAAPPNFFMNGNQGPTNTWKSSVKHVNEANNEAGQAIYDAAIQHKEPGPVQDLKFEQIDKATGQKTGVQLPYAQHPAGEIKEYFKQVTSELEAQTKATYKTVQNGSFTQSYSTAAASMASEFTPKNYDQFKAHANKAADYLVLSKSAAAGLPTPEEGIFEEQWEDLSPKLIAFKNACKAKFQTLSDSEQKACKAYTGSSYANWNQALRAGDKDSSAYQSAQAMVKGFAKAAMDIPEGTILWRGIGVGEDTYKSVTGAVLQDGSFQSSSFGSAPAFSSHKTWLKIHVGKGVKGLHATSFSNFGSSEREIIIKNNVRYAVLNVTHHKNFVDSKGKSHGPKTIVDLLALPHED